MAQILPWLPAHTWGEGDREATRRFDRKEQEFEARLLLATAPREKDPEEKRNYRKPAR